MKKVLFAAALMFGALTVSAQQSVVKEAKSKKGNPVEAAKIIEAALTNPETANDPNTWKLAGDFQKAIYDAENEKLYLNAVDKSKVADTPKMYNSLMKLFEYYLKCDEVEQAQVASGALKKAKLRKKNAEVLKAVRINLASFGGDAFNAGDHKTALQLFGLFVDVAGAPMFANDPAVAADTLTSLYAAYASLAASTLEDKENVMKYGKIGKEHKDEGYRSLMYMAEICKNDTVQWLEYIKEGVDKFPSQQYFIANLMQYYIDNNLVNDGLAQVNKMLDAKEEPYYLYLKGVLLLNDKKYDELLTVCDKVIAINNGFVPEVYSLKGGSYYWQARAIVEENANLQIDDPKYNTNEAKIKELFELAKPQYEKSKELAPDNKELWGQYLYSIYYALGSPELPALEKELGY